MNPDHLSAPAPSILTAGLTLQHHPAGASIFSADASDLPPSRGAYTLIAPSGNSLVVIEACTVRDREGDLLYTDYRPSHIERPGVTLRVFND